MGGAGPGEDRRAESSVLEAVLAGDEAAFCALVDRHQLSLVRLARLYTRNDALADEVVQDAWMVMLDGLADFGKRSSLRTWLSGIVINLSRAKLRKEQRSVPLSSLVDAEDDRSPTVAADRFLPADHHWAGHWSAPPEAFPHPEGALLGSEMRTRLSALIAALPEAQRAVVVLRDVEGFSSEEVCTALELSESNQRVLLHRARAKLRQGLEDHLATREAAP